MFTICIAEVFVLRLRDMNRYAMSANSVRLLLCNAY